jgi:hypothetical protein
MTATQIRYSQELQETVAPREGFGAYDAAVREAIAVLAGRFAEVLVTPAWTGSEEGAEVTEDGTALRLTILPVRFADPLRLTRSLRHELGHVADILDETFAHGAAPDGLVVTHTLRRRFKLLWACSIDGRTASLGASPLHQKQEYEAELARLFSGISSDTARAAVAELWEGERPSYCCLMRMAADLVTYPDAARSMSGVAVAV